MGSDSPLPAGLSRIAALLERHHRPLLGMALLAAVAVRAACLLAFRDSPYWTYLLWDDRIVHEWAAAVAAGSPHAPLSAYGFSGLWAAIQAGLYAALGPDPLWARLASLLSGVGACWLVYRIGRELAGRTPALIACAAAGLYGPFVLYSALPGRTSLAVLLSALVVWLLLRQIDRPSPAGLGILGLAAGLLGNVRGNFLAVAPLLPLVVLAISPVRGRAARRTAGLGMFLAGLLLAIGPFSLHDRLATGGRSSGGYQTGFNLYLGNNPDNPTPYYRPVPFAESSPFEQGVQFTIEASRREGRTLSNREASAFWTRQALQSFEDDPSAALRRLGWKGLATLNRFEAGDDWDLVFLGTVMPFFRLPWLAFGLVLPLGLAGLCLLLPGSSKARALVVVLILYLLTLVVQFPNMRYRLPAVVMLIPAGAAGLERLAGAVWQGRGRTVAVWLAAAVAAVAVSNLSLPGSGDRSAYQNTHAIALRTAGRIGEAVEFWGRSSASGGVAAPFADLALAGELFRAGDRKGAFDRLGAIPDGSFAAAQKYEMAGDLAHRLGRRREAGQFWRRSLAINSGNLRVGRKLVGLHDGSDPAAEAAERAGLARIEAFYRP